MLNILLSIKQYYVLHSIKNIPIFVLEIAS